MARKPAVPGATPIRLAREMGLLGLAATGICSMMGAAINVIPFMLQRSVPGIGPYVLPAYLFAALPAVFAALKTFKFIERPYHDENYRWGPEILLPVSTIVHVFVIQC